MTDTQTSNPVTTTEAAADWNARIAAELGVPIIPEGSDVKLIREIEAQQEKHKLFSRALIALARTGKKQ